MRTDSLTPSLHTFSFHAQGSNKPKLATKAELEQFIQGSSAPVLVSRPQSTGPVLVLDTSKELDRYKDALRHIARLLLDKNIQKIRSDKIEAHLQQEGIKYITGIMSGVTDSVSLEPANPTAQAISKQLASPRSQATAAKIAAENMKYLIDKEILVQCGRNKGKPVYGLSAENSKALLAK